MCLRRFLSSVGVPTRAHESARHSAWGGFATMGFCVARTPTGIGMSHVQPVVMRGDRTLKHTAPLISAAHSDKGFLGGIFSNALTNGRAWTGRGVPRSFALWYGCKLLYCRGIVEKTQ